MASPSSICANAPGASLRVLRCRQEKARRSQRAPRAARRTLRARRRECGGGQLLRRRSAPLDDVRSEDEQPSRLRLESEREVRRFRAADRSAVLRVTAEERCERLICADGGLHSGHDRAAQRPCNIDRLGLADEARGDLERVRSRDDVSCRRHQPEPEKAPITEDERALDRYPERNLDVPEALLLEACSVGERLDATAIPLEWLALETNCLYHGIDPGMP